MRAVATWWHLGHGPGQGPVSAPDFWWLLRFRLALRVGSGDDERRWCERGHRSPNRSMPQSATLWVGFQATKCIDLTLHGATTKANRLLDHSRSRVTHGLHEIVQIPAPVKELVPVHDDRHPAPTADYLQAHGQVDAFTLQ